MEGCLKQCRHPKVVHTLICFPGSIHCPTSSQDLGQLHFSLGSPSVVVQVLSNFLPTSILLGLIHCPISQISPFPLIQLPLGHPPPSNFNLPQVHLVFHFLMCIGVHGCSSSLFSSCIVQLPWGNGVARFIYHPTSSRELDQA
jgi:hypothetical protein